MYIMYMVIGRQIMDHDDTKPYKPCISLRSQSEPCNIRRKRCQLDHLLIYVRIQSPCDVATPTGTLPPMSSACTPPPQVEP